ncbi:sensor domain-containing phosphodiesterase [Acetobacter fallax]|uniref:EAL domain-containing protein n=1 Tax=Acetobacter fallax TaxID=1737473 RepID=A0ABX0KAH6_9PROT|nr:EAL domain-containing protein [Acetobacter fallax]NHO32757.1 EAL domain-containing protein [Acetobacter fallax]NHO36320.1 EAL domain-containing protein [Acetobacter fallax]
MAADGDINAGTAVDRKLEQLAALAFAAADVLFEVDRAFRIRHVGGGIQKLTGHLPKAVRGLSLFDLLIPADRVYFRRSVEEFDSTGAMNRITVRFLLGKSETSTAILGMSDTPGSPGERLVTATIMDRAFVACPEDDGLLDRDGFISFARRLTPPPGEAPRFSVVMLSLPMLLKTQASRESTLSRAFLAEVQGILRTYSEGGAVTRLNDGAFAYIWREDKKPGVIEQEIASAADSLLASTYSRSLPLDSSLQEQKEIESALDYALTAFAKDASDTFSFENLPECLAAAVHRDRGQASSCRNIIEDDTFFQVLQPIIALKTGAIQHYEVLTRFAEGVARGIANTGEFIKIAEQIGMINTFDLLNCVKTIRLLQKMPPGVRVALNLSGRSVQSPEFADQLMNILDAPDSKVAPSRLLIEITETRGITDFERPTALLQKLFRRGHRICLDDFGAGAMSFEYLRRFPVNYIKIDGEFFRNAMTSGRDRILIRAIARCSFELGCRTVAEMVETDVEAAMARELGIECGQGWLFGKPITTDALLATLSRGRNGAFPSQHAQAEPERRSGSHRASSARVEPEVQQRSRPPVAAAQPAAVRVPERSSVLTGGNT